MGTHCNKLVRGIRSNLSITIIHGFQVYKNMLHV